MDAAERWLFVGGATGKIEQVNLFLQVRKSLNYILLIKWLPSGCTEVVGSRCRSNFMALHSNTDKANSRKMYAVREVMQLHVVCNFVSADRIQVD